MYGLSCQISLAFNFRYHDTFFKMADNTVRDEGPINPTEEAKIPKRLGANLATPEKAKIAQERKM